MSWFDLRPPCQIWPLAGVEGMARPLLLDGSSERRLDRSGEEWAVVEGGCGGLITDGIA
jgi:hypothetical protein